MFGWKTTKNDEEALTVEGWDTFPSLMWSFFALAGGIFFLFTGKSWWFSLPFFPLCLLFLVGFRFSIRIDPHGVYYKDCFLFIPYKSLHLPLTVTCESIGLGDWGDTADGEQCTLQVWLEQEEAEPYGRPEILELGFGPLRNPQPLQEVIQEGLHRFRFQGNDHEQERLQRGKERAWLNALRRWSQRWSWFGFRITSSSIKAHWVVWSPTFIDIVTSTTVLVLSLLLPMSWWGRGVGLAFALLHLVLSRQHLKMEGQRLECHFSRWWIPFQRQQFPRDFRVRLEQNWEWPHGREIVISSSNLTHFEFFTVGNIWDAESLYLSIVETREVILQAEKRIKRGF